MSDIKQRTPNQRFILPRFNQVTWIEDEHSNWRAVDGLLTRFFNIADYSGVWLNSTEYGIGARVLDPETAVIFECVVAHISATLPTTFTEDRIARPTYWVAFTEQIQFKGQWLPSTDYAAGDFVTNGRTFAVALTSHQSTVSFASDVATGLWQELIDGDTIVADAEAAKDDAEAAAIAAAASAALFPSPTAGTFLRWDDGGTPVVNRTPSEVRLDLSLVPGTDVLPMSGGALTGSLSVDGDITATQDIEATGSIEAGTDVVVGDGLVVGAPTGGLPNAGEINAEQVLINGQPVMGVLLDTITVSNAAQLAFLAGDPTKYIGYLCILSEVFPVTDAQSLVAQVSTDGGANWVANTYLYNRTNLPFDATPTLSTNGSASISGPLLAGPLSNSAGGTFGEMDVHTLPVSGSSGLAKISWNLASYSGTAWIARRGDAIRALASAQANAFRIISSSGNISGVMRVYGIQRL